MPLSLNQLNKPIIHKASILFALPVVLISFFISRVHQSESSVSASNLGWLTIFQFAALTIVMLTAWWSAPKIKKSFCFNFWSQSNPLHKQHPFIKIRLLLAVGVILRLVLIPIDSYTSNDVARYMFDGKIAISGLDPYQVNHNAPELAELKAKWQPPEEHAKYPTLYPPLALSLFALSASFGADNAALVWKLITTLASIATLGILTLMLRDLKKLHHLSLVALSPLLILEAGVGIHLDAVSTLLIAFALFSFLKHKHFFTGLFIGLGVLTKILPLMLMLPLFFGVKKIKPALTLATSMVLTVAVGYGIILALGFIPVGSIVTLFEKWRFGSPLFSFLSSITSGKLLLASMLFFIISAASIIFIKTLKLKQKITVTSPLLVWSMAIILLISPVVFPWYLMPLVPLVVLNPRPFMLTWISLMPLTYEVLGEFAANGSWMPANWPLMVVTISAFVALYFELRQSKLEQQNSNYQLT